MGSKETKSIFYSKGIKYIKFMDEELYDTFSKTLYRTGSPVYKGDGNPLSDLSTIPPSALGDGFSPTSVEMVNGNLQSGDFQTGVQGWSIDAEGNAEFNDGTFRGTFNIGGTIITIDNTEDIQTNIDTISTAGGGILYLQPGTYTLTADISIPSGVVLQGVSRDDVIIDCNLLYAVKIAGTDVYSAGTVTINNGDTTLEGAGTTWTAAMVGRYVLLDGLWYEITARTDNDTLTIETYQGVNLAGSTYVIATVNFTAQLNKVTVTGATGSGVIVQYAMEPTLNDVVVYGNGIGIDMDYVTFPVIITTCNENGVNLDFNFVEGFSIDFSEFNFSTTGVGVVMVSSRNATVFNSSCNDNTGNGFSITGGSKIAFISVDISGNGGNGVEFISSNNDNQLTDIVLDGNASDGIKLTATSDRNQFVAVSSINNGGWGINIAAATCDANVINAPSYSGNSSGTLNDLGTGTVILPQSLTAYAPLASPTFTGTVTIPTPFTLGAVSVTSTGTELNFVDGVTSAIQTQLDAKVNDTGDETIAGVKTFSSDPLIPDEAYGSGWNGVLEPPTKNAVYDKIESLTGAVFATGLASKAINSTTDQTIAHGLGITPKLVKVTCMAAPATNEVATSTGAGTSTTVENVICLNTTTGSGVTTFSDNTSIILLKDNGDTTQAQANLKTLDATNIVLEWTTNNNSGSERLIIWEAYG